MSRSLPELQPVRFQAAPPSPFRRLTDRLLRSIPEGVVYCGISTFDIENYEIFVRRCRAARCRPPSLYAYFARCMGVVLRDQKELLTVRDNDWVITPERVDVEFVVEARCEDGSTVPRAAVIQDVSEKPLEELCWELTTRMRPIRRAVLTEAMVQANTGSRFAPPWTPQWWHNCVRWARERRDDSPHLRAARRSVVRLSSTSQWLGGSTAWAVQCFPSCALSITLGGVSRRPVVVGTGDKERIEIHQCLDIAFHFNHWGVDGAPATRFGQQLRLEVESGRLLEEFPIVPRENSSRQHVTQQPIELQPDALQNAFQQAAIQRPAP